MSELRLIVGIVIIGAGAYALWASASDKVKAPKIDNFLKPNSSGLADKAAKKYESSLNMWTTPPKGQKYETTFKSVTAKYGLPDGLLSRVAYQESRYNPAAKSGAGAIGLMQFLPATAKQYGINPLNPEQSIEAAGHYLASLYKQFGNWQQAVASYNWGQGNVARKGLAKAPLETRNYYAQILGDIGLA